MRTPVTHMHRQDPLTLGCLELAILSLIDSASSTFSSINFLAAESCWLVPFRVIFLSMALLWSPLSTSTLQPEILCISLQLKIKCLSRSLHTQLT